MKIKLGALLFVLLCSGCGFLDNSPKSTVSKYFKLAEKTQNIEALEKLYSDRAKSDFGPEKVLVDVISAVEMGTKIAATGESMPFLKPEETINGDLATVTFYALPGWAEKNDKANQAKVLLIKENGEWKIYAFGQSGEPNPKFNSIFAAELKKAYRIQPELMNTRLMGKTIILEGNVNNFGEPGDDDSGSVAISTSYNEGGEGYILCKLKSGASALLGKHNSTPIKKIKVKGTLVGKDPNDSNATGAEFVLDNCTVQ